MSLMQGIELDAVLSRGDEDEDDVDHHFCSCTPTVAFCGARLTYAPEDIVDVEFLTEDDCSMCIEDTPDVCPNCGEMVE